MRVAFLYRFRISRLGKLYVDGDATLSFETRLPDLNKAIITVGVEYKRSKAGRFVHGHVFSCEEFLCL
jgi:hypothetical protein